MNCTSPCVISIIIILPSVGQRLRQCRCKHVIHGIPLTAGARLFVSSALDRFMISANWENTNRDIKSDYQPIAIRRIEWNTPTAVFVFREISSVMFSTTHISIHLWSLNTVSAQSSNHFSDPIPFLLLQAENNMIGILY